MLFLQSQYRQLPSLPGVYIFIGKDEEILYVGKAIDLKKRVSSYFKSYGLGEKTKALVSQIKKIRTIEVESELEAFHSLAARDDEEGMTVEEILETTAFSLTVSEQLQAGGPETTSRHGAE